MSKWQQPVAKSAAKTAPKAKAAPEVEGLFTRRRVGTVIAGLLAVQLLFTVVFGKNGIVSYLHKQRESEVLAQEIQELQRQNAALRDETNRLAQDPSAIEHQAREQLHYTRPGEVIYALPDAPANTPQTKK